MVDDPPPRRNAIHLLTLIFGIAFFSSAMPASVTLHWRVNSTDFSVFTPLRFSSDRNEFG